MRLRSHGKRHHINNAMEFKRFIFNPFQENTYLISNEAKECIIIDPGALFEQERTSLIHYIKQNGLKLTRILLTHPHLDHIFGCKSLYDEFGILPEAHKEDEFLLDLYPEQIRMFGLPNQETTVRLKGYLSDGDKIQFGETVIEVIHTPGHSQGGLCFYLPKERIVFSGDTLFQCSIGRTDLQGGDMEQILHSIRHKILTLPEFTTLYPGHGPETEVEFERTHNPFLHE